MTSAAEPSRRRLDERVQPGWARTAETLFRFGGFAVGALALVLGFLSGGFFLVAMIAIAVVAVVGGLLLARVVARESWYSRPNAMPITVALLVAFPVAVIVFAQVAGPLLSPPPASRQEFSGDLSPGQEMTHTVAVDPRIVGMEVSIEVESTDGSAVRWFVEDPSGQSQWSGRTDELGNSASKQLTPAPGTWTIHVIDDTGSASYALAWQGWTTATPQPSQASRASP